MKKRYTEEQIIKAIKQHEAGQRSTTFAVTWACLLGHSTTGVASMPDWK